MVQAGTASQRPVLETFGSLRNLGLMFSVLVGLVMGMTVVWYCSQFYALVFLSNVLKVDGVSANLMMGWALLFGCPFFLFFGWLSDVVPLWCRGFGRYRLLQMGGRKTVLLTGCALAAFTYFDLFGMLSATANPALDAARQRVPVMVVADPETCHFMFNPVGTAKFTTPCDVARTALLRASVAYSTMPAPSGFRPTVQVGNTILPIDEPAFAARLGQALIDAGYPPAANAEVVRMRHPFDFGSEQTRRTIFILWLLVLLATMPYGPIAAALTETFPTRIRYTAMSFPYHVGAGWVGGMLPPTAYAISASAGDPLAGLWYPVGFAAVAVVLGALFVRETSGRDINADDGGSDERSR
jgi:hypothetical protein